MKTRLLSAEECHKIFDEPIVRTAIDEYPPFDFWPYFKAVESADFQHYNCFEGRVEHVYREPSAKFEHFFANTDRSNVYMVLVLDRLGNKVFGHCLLNVN